MKWILVVMCLGMLTACRTCPTIDEQQIKDQYYNLGQADMNAALVQNNQNCVNQNEALRQALGQVQTKLAECLEADSEK